MERAHVLTRTHLLFLLLRLEAGSISSRRLRTSHDMASAIDTVYEAPSPPEIIVDPPVLPPNLKLTDAQQKMYDDVLRHFDKEGSDLTEEEKFWLVRLG